MIIDTQGKSVFEYYREFWTIVWQSATKTCQYLVIIFAALILFYIIFGKPLERKFFGFQSLILMVVLFNPYSMYYLSSWVSLSSRYFRYMWIVPITVTLGYFVANLIVHRKPGVVIAYLLSFFALYYGVVQVKASTRLLFTSVEPNYGMELVDNKYKIERDTLDVVEIIENDKKDPSRTAKVLYGYNIFMDIRTYDASLYNGFNLNNQNKYRNTVITQQTVNKIIKKEQYKNLLLIMVNISAPHNPEIPTISQSDALKAIRDQEMEYIVFEKTSPYYEQFVQCGNYIGESTNFIVLKSKLEE